MFQEHLPSSWEGEGRKKGEGGRERESPARASRGGPRGGEREETLSGRNISVLAMAFQYGQTA